MLRFGLTQHIRKAGLPPGTLPLPAEDGLPPARIALMQYAPGSVREEAFDAVAPCLDAREGEGVAWINVDARSRPEVIAELGERLGVHPLVQEDIATVGHRPKVEDYGDYLFFIMKMLSVDAEGSLQEEEICLLLFPGLVVSFQERPGDVFDALRERIRQDKGRVRREAADYLLYAIMDAVIDNYLVALDGFSARTERIEEQAMVDSGIEIIREVHGLRRELLALRKAVWPLREVLGGMLRDQAPLLGETARTYLRDAYDHAVQVMDIVEGMRETVSAAQDIHLTAVSNRMNEVMKVLAVIATLFIPVTFIAGVYGMNFEGMPELQWRYGYPAVLTLMGAVMLGMLFYFRRRKWL